MIRGLSVIGLLVVAGCTSGSFPWGNIIPPSVDFVLVQATDYVSKSPANAGTQEWVQMSDEWGDYMVIVPDLRVTHSDPFHPGSTYLDDVGGAAISYHVDFPAGGRWYVWVNAKPKSTEGNGVHVALNGKLEGPGKSMQWCTPTGIPSWSNMQRGTGPGEFHDCGRPGTIWLDVPGAGTHTVTFHQREDGFGMYEFLLTQQKTES